MKAIQHSVTWIFIPPIGNSSHSPLVSLFIWAGGVARVTSERTLPHSWGSRLHFLSSSYSLLSFTSSSQPAAAVLKIKRLIHYAQINPAGVIPAGHGGSDKLWVFAALESLVAFMTSKQLVASSRVMENSSVGRNLSNRYKWLKWA